ncbi:esterase/lipase family protein [Limnoglobus roseus]|uniref:Alpha/beta hydrolase n=1 Tax=Limnoglobus roseus TaxID=2598579 RepID=A0A5C1AFR9_9BACT|nr:alpha/beta fold hydrolase [Limnoglobus roseus]QEL17063.1 alpha/beta hydrolase [Limnoglobus roseus]
MLPTLTSIVLLPFLGVTELPTAVWQVAPEVRATYDGQPLELKKTKDKAAFLVHGLMLHPIKQEKSYKTELHDWQYAKAGLVQALASEFDVYAFSYAQTTAVDVVASTPGMRNHIKKLRRAGYKEIVLIGHSAGGIIIRQFAERYPDSGVTKVIEVAAPNFGSDLAMINVGLPKPQVQFIKSLAPPVRTAIALDGPKLSSKLEICCVVCKLGGLPHDTMVHLDSQWPADLQKQGVPATLVVINHFDAMKGPHAVQTISTLAKEKLVRWTPAQVEQGRRVMFGSDPDAAAAHHPEAERRPLVRVIGRKLLDR